MKTKCAVLLCVIVFMPGTFLKLDQQLQAIDIPIVENSSRDFPPVAKPEIIPREDWDPNWPSIRIQYELPLGSGINMKVSGRSLSRHTTSISYLEAEGLTHESLDTFFVGAVWHHTAVDTMEGESELEQVIRIVVSQILSRGFNDIAYHFVIGRNGTIFAALPIDHMGHHAGGTKETDQFKLVYVYPWRDGPRPATRESYAKLFPLYVKAMKMDPDWRRIGVLSIGHFDKYEPSYAQKISAISLANWLKYKYGISDEGMLWHSEVPDLITSSGLTSKYSRKSCPGYYYTRKDDFLRETIEDFHWSCDKKTMIERFSASLQ